MSKQKKLSVDAVSITGISYINWLNVNGWSKESVSNSAGVVKNPLWYRTLSQSVCWVLNSGHFDGKVTELDMKVTKIRQYT